MATSGTVLAARSSKFPRLAPQGARVPATALVNSTAVAKLDKQCCFMLECNVVDIYDPAGDLLSQLTGAEPLPAFPNVEAFHSIGGGTALSGKIKRRFPGRAVRYRNVVC